MIEAIQFSSFGEFLDMGGYAFNVWSVYLLFAIFLSVNLMSPFRKRKQIMRDLQRRKTMSDTSIDSAKASNDLPDSGAAGETQ
jgi:heme exporter protein CcmD